MATGSLPCRRISHHLPQGRTHAALVDALLQGDLLKVRDLSKEHRIDMNTEFMLPHPWRGMIRMTPLQYAARKGMLNMVNELLTAGCVPDGVSFGEDKTPLHLACGYPEGNVSFLMVVDLLHHGAQVNRYVQGRTPLIAAVLKGHTNVIEALCDHGVDVNHWTDNFYSESALGCASRYDKVWFIGLLCQKGADVNHPCGRTKTTPLLQACHDLNIEGAAEFLKNGADINLGFDGNSPLHIICDILRWHLVHYDIWLSFLKLLLECKKCHYNKRNSVGKTALELLLAKLPSHMHLVDEYLDAAQLMVNAGCSVTDTTTRVIQKSFMCAMDIYARRVVPDGNQHSRVVLEQFCNCFALLISAGWKIDQLDKLSIRYPDACAVLGNRCLLNYAKECLGVQSLSRLSKLVVRASVHKPLANHIAETGLPLIVQECILLKHHDIVCCCL